MAIIVEQNCCSVNEKAAQMAMYPAEPPKPWQMQLLQHERLNSASNEMMAVHPKILAYVDKLRPLANRRVMSLVLVVIGVVLLGYVTGQYWGMYRSQKNLEAEWQRQAATTSSTETAASGVPGKASDSVPVSPDRVLTRLEIPKIQMDAIVVEGASRHDLSEGPGHMKETAQPGETGNAVITAHRDTFFRHIYELNKGDQIQVRRRGRTFTYEVTGKRIVMPEDISVIKPTTNPQLTLITCYPTYYIGPAPKRLVVFSKLIQSDGQPVNQSAQAHSNGQ
jgi:sortase A